MIAKDELKARVKNLGKNKEPGLDEIKTKALDILMDD